MDAKRVQASLELIRKTYRKILDASNTVVIAQAVAGVAASKALYDQSPEDARRPWGYTIPDAAPLRFIASKSRHPSLQVDLACDIRWAEGDIPVAQGIKMRIWSQHMNTIFDANRDASQIEASLKDPNWAYTDLVDTGFDSKWIFSKVSGLA